jgi:hypothetical protein
MIIAILLAIFPANSAKWHVLSSSRTGQLLVMVRNRLSIMKPIDAIANYYGFRAALFGSGNKYLALIIQEGITKYGSDVAFEEALLRGDPLPLADWHRARSDIDIILIPSSYLLIEDVALARTEFQRARKDILAHYPTSAQFTGFEVRFPPDFFRDFPPAQMHFEPTSYLVITKNGVEHIPELTDVYIPSRGPTDLTELGLRQFASGEIEFFVNEEFAFPDFRKGVFINFKSFLRFVRDVGILKGASVSTQSWNSMNRMLSYLRKDARDELISLLQKGNEGFLSGGSANDEAQKLIQLLENAQGYSSDSLATYDQLSNSGALEVLEDAGISSSRVRTPLRNRAVEIPSSTSGNDIGQVYFVGPLADAQSVAHGGLYVSGETLAADGTPALLTYRRKPKSPQKSGVISVAVEINPDAHMGPDLETRGDLVFIKTRQAIAVDANGDFRIHAVDIRELLSAMALKVRNASDAAIRENAINEFIYQIEPLTEPVQEEIWDSLMHDVGPTVQHDMEYRLIRRMGNFKRFLEDIRPRQGKLEGRLRQNFYEMIDRDAPLALQFFLEVAEEKEMNVHLRSRIEAIIRHASGTVLTQLGYCKAYGSMPELAAVARDRVHELAALGPLSTELVNAIHGIWGFDAQRDAELIRKMFLHPTPDGMRLMAHWHLNPDKDSDAMAEILAQTGEAEHAIMAERHGSRAQLQAAIQRNDRALSRVREIGKFPLCLRALRPGN